MNLAEREPALNRVFRANGAGLRVPEGNLLSLGFGRDFDGFAVRENDGPLGTVLEAVKEAHSRNSNSLNNGTKNG
jgi:hypothetical protein